MPIGDVVMSIYPLDIFRQKHGDNGPQFTWYPCDRTSLAGTPLALTLPTTPDFRGRYPRGYTPSPPPDLVVGETGDPGTTIGQTIMSHSHSASVTMPYEGFDHGDGEHGPVVNDRPTQHQYGVAVSATGGAENRPNSVIVYFYIAVR